MTFENHIYLDYNATTPVDREVLEAMMPFFRDYFGNASSKTHFPGRLAAEAVEDARKITAAFVGGETGEIIFTSCSTESINLGIRGVTSGFENKGKQIITWKTEHKAVLDTCAFLERSGFQITLLPVNRDGLPDLELYTKTVNKETLLTVVMLANNETGVIMPVAEISSIAHKQGSLVFCDATQAAGKIRIDVNETGVDMLCISAHKMYGPKGVGALYVRRKNPRVTLQPLIYGGGHENGLRAGTLNVPGIVGLGKACEIARERLWDDASAMSRSRTIFEQFVTANGLGYVNGNIKNRLPNTTNICFPGIKAAALISAVPQIAIATGSACTSALPEPSHVLKAMGLGDNDVYSSVRISVGRFNKEDEILFAAEKIFAVVKKLTGK